MDVGNRIKQLREAKGWTTNRLANRCGISQSFLRAVERNEKGISVENLSIVCDELGLSLKAFFDVRRRPAAPNRAADPRTAQGTLGLPRCHNETKEGLSDSFHLRNRDSPYRNIHEKIKQTTAVKTSCY